MWSQTPRQGFMQDTYVASHNVLVNMCMLTQLLTRHSRCVVFLKTIAYFVNSPVIFLPV